MKAVRTATKKTTNNPVFPGETMYPEDKRNYANTASKLTDQQSPMAAMAGCASRETSKTYLLNHAERLRREAANLEILAYAVEHISGDAETTLWRLLSGSR